MLDVYYIRRSIDLGLDKFDFLSKVYTYTDLEDGEYSPDAPEPFNISTDLWETIVTAVKENNISKYNVGDTKEIDMGEYGTHTLRIANTSTPSELRSAIMNTITISGYGLDDSNNFTSIDRIYLLVPQEIYVSGIDSYADKTKNLTRTLDYYKNLEITTNNYSEAIRKMRILLHIGHLELHIIIAIMSAYILLFIMMEK